MIDRLINCCLIQTTCWSLLQLLLPIWTLQAGIFSRVRLSTNLQNNLEMRIVIFLLGKIFRQSSWFFGVKKWSLGFIISINKDFWACKFVVLHRTMTKCSKYLMPVQSCWTYLRRRSRYRSRRLLSTPSIYKTNKIRNLHFAKFHCLPRTISILAHSANLKHNAFHFHVIKYNKAERQWRTGTHLSLEFIKLVS